MGIRKAAHWHKPDPRECLIDDVNEWIRAATKDPTDGLPADTKITRRDLAAICRAIAVLVPSKRTEQ